MPVPRKPLNLRLLRPPIAGAMFAMTMALAACGIRPAKGPDEFVVRSARLNTQGANDPQERLRDELGEFKTSFDRIIARMEMSASSLAGDDPERLGQIQRDIRPERSAPREAGAGGSRGSGGEGSGPRPTEGSPEEPPDPVAVA